MEQYKLPSHINPDKVFIVNRSELERRLEPKFYTSIYLENETKLANSVFPLVSIKDVTSIVSDGTHFTPNYVDGGVKFISVKDVRQSSIDLNNSKFITEEEADFLDKRCKPQKGDILLTKVGTIGLAAVVDVEERFQIFVSLALLRPKSNVMSDYLEIFLNSNIAYLQYDRIVKGAGVPDLHLEDIRRIKISLPSLSKQQQIVDLYKEAYNLKQQKEAKAKALLDSIDSYLLGELGIALPEKDNSLQKRVFTAQFSEVTGGRFDAPSAFSDFSLDSTKYDAVPFLQYVSMNPQWGTVDSSTLVSFIPMDVLNEEFGAITYKEERLAEESKGYTNFAENDILWAKITPCMQNGKSTIAEGLSNGLGFGSTEYYVFRVDNTKINRGYVFSILRLKALREAAMLHFGGAAGHQRVSSSFFKELSIPFPPLEKQNEIAKHIQSIREQAKQLQNDAKAILEQAKQEVELMILG
ncbi:MAG: restriction endonuclease subunit S [Dysgonomonas sp.]